LAIRLQLEIEDEEVSALLLWLNQRKYLTFHEKVDLLTRASHWLGLVNPVEHPTSEKFPNIKVDVDGQPLEVSELSGRRFQSGSGSPSQDGVLKEGLKAKASHLSAS